MRMNGCVFANKLIALKHEHGNDWSNGSVRNLFDPVDSASCKRHYRDPMKYSSQVSDQCICTIECGETLYCGMNVEEDCMVGDFDYWKLLFYEKPIWLYTFQVISSLLTMFSTLVRVLFLWKRGVRFITLVDESFIFDSMNGILSLLTLAYAPCLKDIYIPLFLQCFTVRLILHNLLFGFDIIESSSKLINPVIQSITDALLLVASILFASICFVHYLERVACPVAGSHIATLFDGLWFIIVTITTVGYGDLSPVTPLGQLSVIVLILIILLFLPKTLGDILVLITASKQNYRFYHCDRRYRHVVLCVSKLNMIMINDYLEEFYAFENNFSLVTVILTAQPPTPLVKIRLEGPALEKKIFVIVGSALVIRDLERANVALSKACIILSDRLVEDAHMSDQETILRASSVQRFAPHVKLYIRIFKPENQMNLKFADQVLCEGQFKQMLMANNCLYPGFSSFLTLLLHTTTELVPDNVDWEDLYRYCSGNEIYDVRLEESIFFSQFAGRTFLFAAIFIQQTTYVQLFAVKPRNKRRIILNPGRHHILHDDDILYYIAPAPEKVLCARKKLTERDLGKFGGIFRASTRDNFSSMHERTAKLPKGFESLDEKATRDVRTKSRISTPSCPVNDPSQDLSVNSLSIQDEEKQHSANYDSTPLSAEKRKLLYKRASNRAIVHEKNYAESPTTSFQRHLSNILDDTEQTIELRGLDNLRLGDNDAFLKKLSQQESVSTYISVNPNPIYIGVKETVHHLNKVATNICCLEAGWKPPCHKKSHLERYRPERQMLFLAEFKRPLIICADEAGSQLYEFLLPLRAYHIPTENLIPIVLILPKIPDVTFLEAIAWIPSIKFIVGDNECVDNLLIAGALDAVGIIICLGDGMPELKEESHMMDAGRLSTAQKLSQIFVNTKLYVELAYRWSMRYLMLHAGYTYHTLTSKSVKDFRHTPYFMSGQAFVPSMMDTLLYQSTKKEYIVELIQLLLGLQQTPGSGYIGKYEVTEADIESYVTYGRLMLALANNYNDLSLAVYRTRIEEIDENLEDLVSQYSETRSFLGKRATALKINGFIPSISNIVQHCHILVNPPADTPLLPDDVFLVIKVCSLEQYRVLHDNGVIQTPLL